MLKALKNGNLSVNSVDVLLYRFTASSTHPKLNHYNSTCMFGVNVICLSLVSDGGLSRQKHVCASATLTDWYCLADQ